MPAIDVQQVSKSFGTVQAVRQVSCTVEEGDLFALLGPNGAGKTTLIRMALDLLRPDSGQIAILGGAMTEAKKDLIGYMPEERGLYQDINLEKTLLYLAALKGVSGELARQRLGEYLERFDLAAYRRKKIKDLSKGMQQKAQLIATLIHQPRLLIVDEPFSGLDPVNTSMVKDLLRSLNSQGVTIVMSTHQMHQVEELCNRMLLIHRGEVQLYGGVEEVRRRFAGHQVLLRTPDALPDDLAGVEKISRHNAAYRLDLFEQATPQQVLNEILARGLLVERFEILQPSLDEIFVRVAGPEAAEAAHA